MTLQVRLPDLIGLALREANVVPELLALTTNVTGVGHDVSKI